MYTFCLNSKFTGMKLNAPSNLEIQGLQTLVNKAYFPLENSLILQLAKKISNFNSCKVQTQKQMSNYRVLHISDNAYITSMFFHLWKEWDKISHFYFNIKYLLY